MKKRISVLSFVFIYFVFCFSVSSQEKVVILADESYPPYSYTEGNELKGIYVDIIKDIDKNLPDFEIILQATPWVRGFKRLETGEFYAIIPPYNRPLARPWMTYSSPILEEKVVIVENSDLSKKWPVDFKNKTIGLNRGFVLLTEEEKKIVKVEEAGGTEENLLKLANGRIDAYANDEISIFWTIKKMLKESTNITNPLKKIKVVTTLNKEWGYIGYSKAYNFPKRLEFEGLVNIEIEKMKKNGKINEIVKKYIGK